LKTIAAITAALVALMTFDASAAVITYRFTAQVQVIGEYNSVTGLFPEVDSSNMTGKTVSVGELASGYLTYDTDLELWPNQTDPGAFGSYLRYRGGVTSSVTFAEGGLRYRSDPVQGFSSIHVGNGPELFAGADSLFLSSMAGSLTDLRETLSISLRDVTGMALSGPHIPEHLSLDDFTSKTFRYSWLSPTGGDYIQMDVLGTLTSLTLVEDVQAVPEPASWLLVLAGMAAIGGIARGRTAL
jgi:hypothetical protein